MAGMRKRKRKRTRGGKETTQEALELFVKARVQALKEVPGYRQAWLAIEAGDRAALLKALNRYRLGRDQGLTVKDMQLADFAAKWDSIGLGPIDPMDPEDPDDVDDPYYPVDFGPISPRLHAWSFNHWCLPFYGVRIVTAMTESLHGRPRGPVVRVDLDLSLENDPLLTGLSALRDHLAIPPVRRPRQTWADAADILQVFHVWRLRHPPEGEQVPTQKQIAQIVPGWTGEVSTPDGRKKAEGWVKGKLGCAEKLIQREQVILDAMPAGRVRPVKT